MKIEYDGEGSVGSQNITERSGAGQQAYRELRDTTLYERGLEIISGPSGASFEVVLNGMRTEDLDETTVSSAYREGWKGHTFDR